VHELAIAEEIVNILGQSVEEKDSGLIKDVYVKVGKLSNVVANSLKFNFEVIIQDTIFRSARLHIEEIPISIWCEKCCTDFILSAFDFFCPNCNNAFVRVTDGDSIYVDRIELIDC
jgi:hydrogenase nickel incorporation protein HypA/HybF